MMTHRALPRRATKRSGAIPEYPLKSSPAPSCAEDVVTFIDPGQEDVAEVDGPDAIVDFLEAEDMLLERVRDKDQALLESDRSRVRHPLGNVMARVLDRREGPGVQAGRRLVQRGGRSAAEKLVRAFIVVEDPEPVESALLGEQVSLGRSRRCRLEGPMHPLVGPVLLGLAGRIRWCCRPSRIHHTLSCDSP
jgi:hypothetical protein